MCGFKVECKRQSRFWVQTQLPVSVRMTLGDGSDAHAAANITTCASHLAAAVTSIQDAQRRMISNSWEWRPITIKSARIGPRGHINWE